MTRVLLVSHEASLTGAPRIAALVGRVLVGRGCQVHILLQRPGPLSGAFAEVAPTRVMPFWRVLRWLWAHPGVLRSRAAALFELLTAVVIVALRRPDLVYVNSSSAAAFVRAARLLGRRSVLHVHESGPVLSHFLARVGIEDLTQMGVRLVACSPSVADDLALRGTPPDDIVLIPSIPDADRVLAGARASTSDASKAIVVGCCGAVERRKGVDLWLAAAEELVRALPPGRVRFVWVGAGEPPREAATWPWVTFTGPMDDPSSAMADFDIMTLPSRDDPFPLVVMEAMLLGKPVVAFDVGGVAHQLGDTGLVVEAGDVSSFAQQLRRLVDDEALRVRLGELAAARARSLFSWEKFEAGVTVMLEDAPPRPVNASGPTPE
ncbi:glycosyltransferase family 4 protein [Nocardioides cavernae]|uniref:glycosyltransferase family 4 protein n=1 Tax=Nocardioides cavernae TaxID=1921566 RepID=UPI002964B76D|nr:glycosyltransferase family 4 protein [Nocardioides cavernae]